jgi:hypothetical protein
MEDWKAAAAAKVAGAAAGAEAARVEAADWKAAREVKAVARMESVEEEAKVARVVGRGREEVALSSRRGRPLHR